MPAEKAVCIRCNTEKRAEEFPLSKSKVNGLDSLCKSCTKEVIADLGERRAAAGSYVLVEEKRCSKCGEVKSTSLFHRRRSSTDGFQRYCKSCSITITLQNMSKRRQQLIQ
jgi:hypothetical protein